MWIVGCDYHPSFQQIAWVDTESGEYGEGPLSHGNGEAERFYRKLKEQGVKVRVGIEATGHARWFERLLAELDYELWVGDAAEIKARRVRKQKNDREDARLLRTLLVENRFPRVWLPSMRWASQQYEELCVQVSPARISISAMRSVERRNFMKVAVTVPFALPLTSFAEVASPLGKPVFVAAGADATGTEHHGPRAGTHLDFKVLTKDTQAGFFLIEHRDVPQGGPVRHLHYAQEEWFYLIDGNKLVIEVGDKQFTLRPGDSILAPRNVPHVWAYVGEKPGRMLMGFTPAGQMEDFFTLSSKQPVDAKIAEAHGMKWLGPPLDIAKL